MKNVIRFFIITGILATGVCAQSPHVKTSKPGVRQFSSMPQELLFRTEHGKSSGRRGVLRYVYSPESKPDSRPPLTVARSYIEKNKPALGLDDVYAELKLSKSVSTPAGNHFYFQQMAGNIPVYRSLLTLTVGTDGRIRFVTSTIRPRLRAMSATPSISVSSALESARTYLQTSGIDLASPVTELLYYPAINNALYLAYRIRMPVSKPRGDWEMIVDAGNGNILQVLNLMMHQEYVNGSGYVWDPDPLSTAGVYYGGPFSDPDGADADSDSLNGRRIEVILNEITNDNGQYRLEGPYVSLVDVEPPMDIFAVESHPDSFLYNRSAQEFENVMVYYHIDKAYRRLMDLGYDIPGLYRFAADPHGLNGEDNSYYIGGAANVCVFGEGGVDDAEDASVIWHEYAHAIQENIAGMFYFGETKSLMEGSSDYWAASYARETAPFAWEHVFVWDAGITSADTSSGIFWRGRRCDLDWTYPEDYVDSLDYEHRNGQIWSSALMKIWQDLGRDVTDRLFIQAHYIWGQAPGFEEAAHAMIQADSLLYNGEHIPVLIHWFDYHGLIDATQFRPQIDHIPLTDSENINGPYIIEAQITPATASLNTDQLWFFYGKNETITDSAALLPGGPAGLYNAAIPGDGTPGQYVYYLYAEDLDLNMTVNPPGAPLELYSFYAGPDTIPPEIDHYPLSDQTKIIWPAAVEAEVTDNSGLPEVWARYFINSAAGLDSFQLTYNAEDEIFREFFPVDSSALSDGDSIFYHIIAIDSSLVRNTVYFPANEYLSFAIRPAGTDIYIDFEMDGGGMSGDGDWQWGTPSYGPPAAYSGSQLWSTILNGAYSVGPLISDLTLENLDMSGYVNATFEFWQWYDIERNFDGANVKIKRSGEQVWQLLTPINGYDGTIDLTFNNPLAGEPAFTGVSNGWIPAIFNLDDFTGDTISVKLQFGSDDSKIAAGWYIDDLRISEKIAQLNPPSGLQVFDNRGYVLLRWEELFKSAAQKSGTDQLEALSYRVYKKIADSTFNLLDSTQAITYSDSNVISAVSYTYYITAVMGTAESPASNMVITTVQAVVSLPSKDVLPLEYGLSQNYPNPFNPTTMINFQIPQPSLVKLQIFDPLGRQVRVLVNARKEAGHHKITWGGRDGSQIPVASGIYFYRLQAGEFIHIRKMILIR